MAVLFVCLGNICRSPMAEGAFRAAVARHRIDCFIDSAGINARRPRDSHAEVMLLLDWLDGHQGCGVPDPYHGDEADFLAAWHLISRATEAMASRLAYLANASASPFDYPPRSN